MSSNNDRCERCDNTPYYEGHLEWCAAMFDLEAEIEQIKDFLRRKFPEP